MKGLTREFNHFTELVVNKMELVKDDFKSLFLDGICD